jgi:hypothetical protein
MQSVGDNACFLTPDVCLEDAEEYIPKIAACKGLDLALVREGFGRISSIVEVVPASLYSQYQSEAIKRIKQRDIDKGVEAVWLRWATFAGDLPKMSDECARYIFRQDTHLCGG